MLETPGMETRSGLIDSHPEAEAVEFRHLENFRYSETLQRLSWAVNTFFQANHKRLPISVKAYSSQETLQKMIAKNVRGNSLAPHRAHAAKSGNSVKPPHYG